MRHVWYIPLAPYLMHGRAAALVVTDAAVDCVVDRDQISPRLSALLEVVGTAATTALIPTFGAVPIPSWGLLSMPLTESHSPRLLTPRITPTGVTVPLPENLISEDLARALAAIGSGVLTLYQRPAREIVLPPLT